MPATIIVGAGIAGLTTAWYLREAGHDVTVVDPSPATGASHAAAGMIAAVSEVVHQHERIRPLMVASARAYPGFITALERAVGRPVGYRSTDTLAVAATPGDREAFADLAAVQRADGMSVDRLTVRGARRLAPALAPGIAGAFRLSDDHQVNPRTLVRALADAVTSPGTPEKPQRTPQGTLIRARAEGVLRTGDTVTGIRLHDGAELHADCTVLCPGTALHSIDGLPETGTVAVRPVYGDILRARLKPGHPALLEQTVRGLVDGRPVYLVPRDDGEIVIGATEREDGFAGVALDGAYQLLRDAQILVPGVADLELTEILARARPCTPDDLPYLGPVPGVDGVVVSTGYSRHGVLLAPLCGQLTAELAGAGVHSTDSTDSTDFLTLTSLERTP